MTGFLGSWIATAIATRAERRKQLLNIAFESGMRQWEAMYKGYLEKQSDFSINPPASYIYFNVKAMELIAKEKFSPEALSKLHAEQKAVTEAFDSFAKK